MKQHEERMQIPFADSSVIMLAIIVIIVGCVQLGLAMVIPLLLCWLVIYAYCIVKKIPWNPVQNFAMDAIRAGFISVLITVAVGALIGTWILSGTVPTIIYYGLEIISPDIFLPATLILCSMLSLATGTSYGSAGSAGLAMMGIGLSMGFPAGVVAGAAISGSLFGDKLSPFSDTTNLCPAMAGGELFKHIAMMCWSTIPAWLICLVLFYFIGTSYSATNYDPTEVVKYMEGLKNLFHITPVALLPLVLVIVLLCCKMSALPCIVIGAVFGGLVGMFIQDGVGVKEVINAMHKGFSVDSDVYLIKRLLNRGGVNSMVDVAYIMIFGMGMGGMLERMGILGNFLGAIMKYSRTLPRLIWATYGVSYLSGMVGCTMTMAQVITGKLLAPLYREKGVAPEVLSRAMEDTSTMGGSLIPWHTNAMFFTGVLTVTYGEYLPFVFICYLCPIISLILAYTGISIKYVSPQTGEPISREEAPISKGA